VQGEGWDVVVNCSGLGAQQLLPDPHCYPIRGQIMRVKAPWVSCWGVGGGMGDAALGQAAAA